MEKQIGTSLFLCRDELAEFILKKHADAIKFIKEHRLN
jgi:hypothetical protein